MEKCEFLEQCTIFRVDPIMSNTDLKDRLQKHFCNSQYHRCARHFLQAAIGKEHVPMLMLPNQHEWAAQILSDHKTYVSQQA